MTDEQVCKIAIKVIIRYLTSSENTESIKEAFLVRDDYNIALEHIAILLEIFEKAKNFLENESKKSEIEK